MSLCDFSVCYDFRFCFPGRYTSLCDFSVCHDFVLVF